VSLLGVILRDMSAATQVALPTRGEPAAQVRVPVKHYVSLVAPTAL